MAGTAFSAANWTGYDSATSDTIASVTGFSFIINVANLSATWKSNVQSDGADIRITKSDGTTELAYDLIDWAYNAGSPTGWIRVLFSGASGTTVTVRVWSGYTGGTATAYSATETYGSDNAYDANWEGYWPLEEDPTGSTPQAIDRTSNGKDGTVNGTIASATGKIGSGWDCVGGNDYFSAGTGTLGDGTALTVSAWVRLDDATVNHRIVSKHATGDYGFMVGITATEQIEFGASSDGSAWSTHLTGTGQISVSTLTHVAVTYDGSNKRAFKNGTELTSGDFPASYSDDINMSTQNIRVGADAVSSNYMNGLLDDVQVHSAARSADWIATEYAQTNDNAAFWNTWSWTAYSGGGGSSVGLIGFAGNRLIG